MIGVFQEFASTFASFADFEAALAKGGLAAGAMQPIAQAADDEWARDREAFVDVGNDSDGPLKLPAHRFVSPTATSARPDGPRGRANTTERCSA